MTDLGVPHLIGCIAALGAHTGWWLAVLATAGLAGWICDGVHVRGFCATEWFGCFQ